MQFLSDRETSEVAEQLTLFANQPGQTVQFLHRLKKADGTVIWVEGSARNLLKAPAVEGIVVNFQDVTERVRADQSEKTQRVVFEQMAAKTPVSTILSTICLLAEEHLPESRTSLLLLDHRRRIRQGASPNLPDELIRSITGIEIVDNLGSCGTAMYRGVRIITEDTQADERWAPFRDLVDRFHLRSCWSVPIHDSKGDVIGAFAVYHDCPATPTNDDLRLLDDLARLTSMVLMRADEDLQLQRSDSLLREAQRRAHLGYWLLDIATEKMEWSDEVYQITGVDRGIEPTLSFALEHVFLREDAPAVGARYREAVSNPGRIVTLDARLKRPDNEVRWVALEGCAFPDELGIPSEMRGIVQDITERKKADEERAQLQSQLWQAQKVDSIGRLAGGVAHDFNNMLAVILGHTELALSEQTLPQSLIIHLQEIQQAAQRSAQLTRQLLTFARRQAAVPTTLCLNKSIGGLLQMLRRLIGENTRLVWQPAEHLCNVCIDPVQVDQIVANMVVNSRDAIDGDGVIRLSTRNQHFSAEAIPATCTAAVPGDFVVLTISDTGVGMSEEILQRIFEPFFTTKPVGEGTGLGLATVQGIVDQNCGFIRCRSSPGGGTTFEICLPAIPTISSEPPVQHHDEDPDAGRGELVLLVEDEERLL
ncbi:MAG: GAF domain-containing protein, partial [Planctomycetaceae bacterium]|nr:GAF domain-containing protein [Planctomycetaceae bacterium]